MIDIVIVNWNSGNLIHSCINSITDNGIEYVKQIIVVDNGSSDNSETLIEDFPKVLLIRNNVNLGFGKSCNIGAKYANSDFILFLNPDTVIYPYTIERIIKYMLDPRQVNVGIAGVQLLDAEGNISRHSSEFPSSLHYLGRALGLHKKFYYFDHIMTDWDHTETKKVDHVIGAFFFVRKSLFEELEGFDERFFVYLEDVDFSYRAKKLGWLTHYYAGAQSMHIAGGTSSKVKARRLFYSLRSRILYCYKHFSLIEATSILFVILFFEPIPRFFQAIYQGSYQTLKDIFSAFLLLWFWLPSWIFNLKKNSINADVN